MSFWYDEKLKEIRTARVLAIPIILAVILFVVMSAIVTVPPGHRGVVVQLGAVQERILGEGFYTITPFVQSVQLMEVRTQKYVATATSASKDLQDVETEVALNYHLDAGAVNDIYQRLGIEYQDRILQPAIQEAVKASTAQYTAEELITQRPKVKTSIEDALKERLMEYGLVLETTSLTDFKFSELFTSAIESKVAAEQEALKAQNILKRIEIEKQQVITEAQGKAEGIRILQEQLKQSPEVLQLKAIEKWDGALPMVTGGAIPFVNIPTGG